MRRATAALLFLLALALAPAAWAGITPVLSVEGQALHWTGNSPGALYILERKPGPSFTTVAGQSYTPAADPGHTDSFRVRPKASPQKWSNEASITWPPEGETQAEREARERREREAREQAEREQREREQREREERERSANTLGRVRVAPDTAEWTSYENPTWAPWVQQHIAYLRLYEWTGEAWLHLGIPTEAYFDPSQSAAYTPWTPAKREAFVTQHSDAAKAKGYGGQFIDDLNGWTTSTLNYRDNLQSRVLEPEAGEQGQLTADVRAAWGPGPILDCNTQMWDALAAIREHSAAFARDLAACSIQTKEFGVSATSGITTASAWASFLEWVDTMHAHGAQVRMTGSIPVTEASFELNLATYFLITADVSSFHGDLIWLSKQLPATTCNTTPVEHGWYCGLNANLGEAAGARERSSSGVWKRSYSAGVVYVNEPGNSTQTVTLPRTMHTISGQAVTSITLAGDTGAVLTG